MSKERKYMTVRQAADELGVDPSRVRQMIRDKQLVAEWFGNAYKVDSESVERAKNRKGRWQNRQ